MKYLTGFKHGFIFACLLIGGLWLYWQYSDLFPYIELW